MTLLVRKASVDDTPAILRANLAMAEETEALQLDPTRLEAGIRAALADPSKGIYWIAELEHEVAGTLLITREWSDWRNRWFWWLQSVYVFPSVRRRGVFAALFERIRKVATVEGACGLRLYVEQENERAQRTYRRLGMEHSHYRLFELDF